MMAWKIAATQTASSIRVQTSQTRHSSVGFEWLGRTSHQILLPSGMVLVRTNTIPDGSKIWWDVRPNHSYPTLEFRVCDVCTRIDEAVCVAAIFQAIIAKLWKLRRDNLTFRVYPHDLIDENKWRAVRYGLDGKLIDFGKQQELPARDLIRELIEWFI